MSDSEEKIYHVTLVEDETHTAEVPASSEPERLAEDPLEHLPKSYNPLTVLPIVAFVLLAISACEMTLMMRLIAAAFLALKIACGVMIVLGLLGMIVLVYSVFNRLHAQSEAHSAYVLSAVVMGTGILIGLIIGILFGF